MEDAETLMCIQTTDVVDIHHRTSISTDEYFRVECPCQSAKAYQECLAAFEGHHPSIVTISFEVSDVYCIKHGLAMTGLYHYAGILWLLRQSDNIFCQFIPAGRNRLPAVTHWTVLGRREGVSLVEFRIETGRMHQIRIHAAGMGCPVVGDAEYGDPVRDRRLRRRPGRPLLHAVELSFLHPATGRRVTFSSPPPADLVYAV